MSHNILVIGASGRLGIQVIRKAASIHPVPSIHAFVRDPSKISKSDTALCTTVQRGDALSPSNVKQALQQTKADTVIMSVGVPDSLKPTTLRADTAKVLVSVLASDTAFAHVRVVVVSSNGAGGTKINIGFGVGSVLSFMLRHVLRDHDLQERAFWDEFQGNRKKQLLIVRPTGLTDGKMEGNVVVFEDGKAKTSHIDRADIAIWILNQICGNSDWFGKGVNITKG